MDGQTICKKMDRWMEGQTDGQRHRETDGQMVRPLEVQTDGQMDQWSIFYIALYII
jgi:hypothetical protein